MEMAISASPVVDSGVVKSTQINIVIIKGHSAEHYYDFRLAQQYASTSMRLSADVNGIKST
jgi:hypothetical protein